MNLPYFAADTLGMTLYQVKSHLAANEVHELRLGPWHIPLPIDVTSDIWTGNEISLWVTVAKSLRLYVIVREKETWLFVLDELGLRECGAKTGFTGRTTKARVLEFKPAIKGLFRWKGAGWDRVQYDGGKTVEEG